ncbi:MAG: DUF202 domain-containing protein [Bacteroidota bacterium]
MEDQTTINKDLILRERLALQRTTLANQSTFLAFLRTSMYFLMAGLSLRSLLNVENALTFEVVLFTISGLVLLIGIINFIVHQKRIVQSEIRIGYYREAYHKS